jgi:uncharacterized protein YfeS
MPTRVDFMGLEQTYDSGGISAVFSAVCDLLTLRLGEYGTAVERIEIVAYISSRKREPRQGLEESFDQFHRFLARLPQIRYHRKLRKIHIGFVSEHFFEQLDPSWPPSAERCRTAAAEVAASLPLLRTRIKPTDDFDLDRFLADAAQELRASLESTPNWALIIEEARNWRSSERARKDPWELLEIDWSKYHPDARTILDDPFYWECDSDLAPHGSDTGADLFGAYRRWNRRHPSDSPLDLLNRLMKRWEVEPIEWTIADEATVQRLRREAPIPLSLCNEAAIALAFAVVKMRGSCPANVVEIALAALTRLTICVQDSTLSDNVKAEWDHAIPKMRRKLESLI